MGPCGTCSNGIRLVDAEVESAGVAGSPESDDDEWVLRSPEEKEKASPGDAGAAGDNRGGNMVDDVFGS